jgi:anthranilate phosphoribosyltransferase
MDIKIAIRQLTQRQDLQTEDMTALMRGIMTGQMTDAQIAAFLVALQLKGVCESELLGAVTVMRELVTKVDIADKRNLVDTCGTGGSGTDTFNISTASAMVAACAGARVAKHGNRGATSKSGSADLLEAAGVKLTLEPAAVARCIETLGVGFMFAPGHHSAMKHVIGPRREIGVRTIFNLLGPLTNPASAPNILMGVFHPDLVGIQVRALERLGAEHAVVVYGRDGMDEVSLGAATLVGELKDGVIREYEIHPEDFGMTMASNRALKVEDAAASKAMLLGVLDNQPGAARDIVALNAGVALYAANVAGSMQDGIVLAYAAIESGAAKAKLNALVALSTRLAT